MKCPNCGSNLTIDDEVCSFCNVANPYAGKHREEMRRFTEDYASTKSKVLKEAKHHSRYMAKYLLIAFLLVLNVVTWVVVDKNYEVERFFISHSIARDYQTHKAKLDELEEMRDYMGLHAYYTANNLSYSELYNEYSSVNWMSELYGYIYHEIMEYATEYDMVSYYNDEQRVEILAQYIDFLYSSSIQDEFNKLSHTEKHQAYMDDCLEQTEALIKTYLNIPAEKMDEFWEGSMGVKQLMIEEGLGFNE